MTEDWSMAPYDESTDIGDFEFGQFGNIPEIDKNEYNGKVLVVVGVSEQSFQGDFEQAAKSLLHYMPGEDRTAYEPWGLMLGENSPAITQAQGQLEKNGNRPFYARLLKKQGRTYPYWTLEAVRAVYDANTGQVSGFRTRDGTIVTNAEAALPMPERKSKGK